MINRHSITIILLFIYKPFLLLLFLLFLVDFYIQAVIILIIVTNPTKMLLARLAISTEKYNLV